VTFSYYEVYITTLRAFSAMGFPHGLDEDAAYIITWLELNNLKGINKLTKISKNFHPYFKKKINLKDVKLKKIINLNKASLLFNGPGLFDYLFENIKRNKKVEITFKNCKDPDFLIPLILKFLKKFKYIKVNWLNKNNKNICFNISVKKILINESNNNLKIKKGDVIIKFFQKKNITKSTNKINQIINLKINQKNYNKIFKPNSKDWNILSKLAEKTFVTASKTSREKGAGGGDDND
tara:strand:- start:1038 stop:1748 length:711 start_codon:yes stop_codon:yes gene_type:complete